VATVQWGLVARGRSGVASGILRTVVAEPESSSKSANKQTCRTADRVGRAGNRSDARWRDSADVELSGGIAEGVEMVRAVPVNAVYWRLGNALQCNG
jgi:hypothetical protein